MTGLAASILGGVPGIALSLFGKVRSGIGAIFTWATENLTHLLLIAFAGAMVWGSLGWHYNAKHKREAASAVAALHTEQREHEMCSSRLDQALKAVADQNEAVQKLHDEGVAKEQAAQAALDGARERLATSEAHAQRIEQDALHEAPSGSCATSQDILDAKGDL